MWKLAFSFLSLLALCSCQYRWGEGLGSLHGEYSVGRIRNLSSYAEAETILSQKLLDHLKRQSRVVLGSGSDKGILLEGQIIKIEKMDLAQDELGRPTEWQFLIEMDLKAYGAHGSPQMARISNRDTLRSSGSYRPFANNAQNNFAGQTSNEDEALAQALDDLAKGVMLYLSTHPQ
jgi:hypothetical protein